MKKSLFICAITAMCLFTGYARGQSGPRVAGLESDSVYMSLLKDELALRVKEDSLTRAVSSLREKLGDDPDNRSTHAAGILKLEGEIFGIRSSIGKIAGRTSAIEQEYIIKKLTDEPSPAGVTAAATSMNSGNDVSAFLTANPYFKEKLPETDYSALVQAQQKETELPELIAGFSAQYDTLLAVAGQYEAADSAAVADSLWQRYSELKTQLEDISKWVKLTQNLISDTKIYSYTFLLDMLNRSDLIGKLNERGVQSRDQIVQLDGNTESVPVSSYPIRKRLVLAYEQTLAQTLGMNKALDSLKKAEAGITAMAFDFPPVDLKERLFLDYDSITVHSPAKYNAANPIPPLTVYGKGAIYRILLGSFQRAQPISTFKGAYPIAVLLEEGQYSYYAGGFATQAEAEAALGQMKKLGFRAPRIALWNYGVYSLLDEAQLAGTSQTSLFRIDISGAGGDLPDAIKELISTSAPGKDISKLGDRFIIGTFTTTDDAEKLAGALRGTDNSLDITVAPIVIGE